MVYLARAELLYLQWLIVIVSQEQKSELCGGKPSLTISLTENTNKTYNGSKLQLPLI